MPYGECKIYSDGSHYIAIPHTTNPYRRRRKPPEKEIAVKKETNTNGEGLFSAEENNQFRLWKKQRKTSLIWWQTNLRQLKKRT